MLLVIGLATLLRPDDGPAPGVVARVRPPPRPRSCRPTPIRRGGQPSGPGPSAARAAAAYLCSADRDVADGDGWWDGVLAYNRSVGYARDVWEAADRCASAA